MLPRGTRDGIFEGDLLPFVVGAFRLMLPAPVGVFVAERGGIPRAVSLPRLFEAVCFAEFGCDFFGGPAGVLERGGAFEEAAVISSRYLSPKTKNGRPYSSSHLSSSFLRSASTLGNSLAILFRIFSSRSSRVGSRFCPLFPRAMRREES